MPPIYFRGMGSNSVSQNAVAATVGYDLQKGYFNTTSPNLPQLIAIFGEVNTANQSGLSTNPVQITNAAQAATLAGAGSPIHKEASILFPQNGGGTVVPVYVYPQAAAVSSVAKVITVTGTGTATGNGTIYLNIAGREIIDGASYAINIVTGDTPTTISTKMQATVAAALSCPVLGTGTTTFIATAKWTGLTSNDITITVDLNSTSLGVTYAVVNTTAGSGTPAVTPSLNMIGNTWVTRIINTYGLVSATLAEFEAWNGIPIPNPGTPTGRYVGTTWKPVMVYCGSTLDDPTSITSAGTHPNNVTIVVAAAPLSAGMPYEAAANLAVVECNIAQNEPQSGTLNQVYPDMPPAPAGSIPQMNDLAFRQKCVLAGCSTVEYAGGVYKIKDLVTTYAPNGEIPPFYRYVRDLNIYFNIKYGYRLRENAKLVGKTLLTDNSTSTAANIVKPKTWKAEIGEYALDLELRALIVNAKQTLASAVVAINSTNPNRLDSTFDVQITGTVLIAATSVTGGFNFSN